MSPMFFQAKRVLIRLPVYGKLTEAQQAALIKHAKGRLIGSALIQENFNLNDDTRVSATNTKKHLESLLSQKQFLPLLGNIWPNLNGEEWRAQWFGQLICALPAQPFHSLSTHTLYECLGDIGNTHPLMALCCAQHNQARDWFTDNKPLHLFVDVESDGLVGLCVMNLGTCAQSTPETKVLQ